MKILIMGLPGSGKTTLARALAYKLKAVHWNADAVRANINSHLGFSEADRIEQARRMGWLCDQVTASGHVAIGEFVCPTPATRKAFGNADCTIWLDTIKQGRFEDTNRMFVPPELNPADYRVDTQDAEFWSKVIAEDLDYRINPTWTKALWIGFRRSQ
jgi:adenylylsulfate kinase